MKRICTISRGFLIPGIIFVQSFALAQTFWGVRNWSLLPPSISADSVCSYLGVKLYALPQVGWNTMQPNPSPVYNWSILDKNLAFVRNLSGTPAVLVGLQNSWASETPQYGGVAPPSDLDRATPLTAPIPAKGYSQTLYDFVFAMVKHIDTVWNGTIYFRCVNEPSGSGHWDISASPTYSATWASRIEDYERCLRTFYKAAHDAEIGTDLQVKVSHGAVMPIYPVERAWYALGQSRPSLQDSLLQLFRSLHERLDDQQFQTWNDVSQVIQNEPYPYRYKELWFEAFLRLSAWVDYQDIHYHFKPRFLAEHISAYDTAIINRGFSPKPWLAAEASMNFKVPFTFNQNFHAEDMVRKWVFGMKSQLMGICTAVIGSPPNQYYGLYDTAGNAYLAAASHHWLSSLISDPSTIQTLDSVGIYHFRFSGPNFLDIVWRDALFDTSNTSVNFTVNFPPGYDSCTVTDVLGNILAYFVAPSTISFQLNQEPRILLWNRVTGIYEKNNIPTSFVLYHNYPNPFNPSTTIRFSIPEHSHVVLKVFDVLGREVATLVDEQLNAGEHAIVFQAGNLPSGVFFYRITTVNFQETKKMLLMR